MDLRNPNVPMDFVENMQGNLLLEALNTQRDSGRFCDIVFHVNNHQYQAHRNVLAACSPYFDTVLDMNKLSKEHLSVVCNDNCIFETLLDYMYRGRVTINKDNASELLRLANHFMISKLKDHCAEYLERSISVANCFSIKDMADRCDCPSLAQNTHYFILCNISEVVRQNEILKFSFGKLENFLSNKLYTVTQEEQFKLIIRWVKWDLADRETYFKVLLSYINWSCFNNEIIYNALKTNDIFRKTETCFSSLVQVLEENQIDLGFRNDVLYQHHSTLQQSLSNPTEDVTSILGARSFVTATKSFDLGPLNPTKKTHKKRFEIFGKSAIKDDDWNVSKSTLNQTAPTMELNPSSEQVEEDDSGTENEETDGNITPEKGGRPHKRKGIPIKVAVSESKSFGKDSEQRVEEEEEDEEEEKSNLEVAMDAFNEEESCDEAPPSSDSDSGEEEEKKVNTAPEKRKKKSPRAKPARSLTSIRGRRRKERMKCPKCEFETCNRRRFDCHVSSAHKNEQVYQCNVCEFSCQWNMEYYKHMRNHFKGPPFVCDDADCEYTSERIQTLLYHRMRHTDERPFKCVFCDQGFRTKGNLKTHSRCHTGEKPYKCEVCGRCFAAKGTLDQHSVTHSDHRPYLCELCGFSTKYQSHLILHRRIHKGDVYKCQYPGCDYSTPRRSQLGCHMRIHMQIKAHVCSTCGRAFTERSHLLRHERIHSDIKPFQCEHCDYSSTRRDKLKDHTRRHHMPQSEKKQRTRKTPNKDTVTDTTIETVNDTNVRSPSEYYCHADPVVDIDDENSAGLMSRELRGSTMATLTSVTSPSAMLPSTASLDPQGLGLLLPTVVSVDARDEEDEADQFRTSLLVSQAHMSEDHDDTSHGSETFMGVPPLQPLTGQSIQLPSHHDLSSTHASHASDISGLSSFMSIF